MKPKRKIFNIPEWLSLITYKEYFKIWTQERDFIMLCEYILTDKTYDIIWKENSISRERVRQCVDSIYSKILKIHKLYTNK